MPSRFGEFARNYETFLRDPIRDRFSTTGDFFHRRKSILIKAYLRQRNFPMASSSWLDVGCGKGELLALCRDSFARAAGCEPSQEMHQSATAEVFHQESDRTLPFPDASFDFVTAVCVYHHVEEPDRVPLTLEIHRVLRAGGIFCMIEHNPWNPVTQLIVKRTPVDAHARLLTATRANRYLREAGFQYAGHRYFLYLPEKWYAKLEFVETALTRVPLGGQYAIFGQKIAAR